MSNIVLLKYDGAPMSFDDAGWFNATAAAAKFGKAPNDWLRLPATVAYVEGLTRKYEKFSYLRSQRGKGGGTWLHPKLAVQFARWLDVDFAIWCDEQIDRLIRSKMAEGQMAVEYLPTYHAVHDLIHEKAALSSNERAVHINFNKLINKTVGIGAGERDSLPAPRRSLLIVAQDVASRALARANDHHDGYQSAKRALGQLEQVLLGSAR